jgi:hypothetical protein
MVRAIEHHQAGRWHQAVEAYGQVIALRPAAAAPWINLGMMWSGLGCWEPAADAQRSG